PPQPTRFPAHSSVTGISRAGISPSESRVNANSRRTDPLTFSVQAAPASGIPKWLRTKKSAFGVTQLAREENSNALLNGEFGEVSGGFALLWLWCGSKNLPSPAGNTNIRDENCLRVRSIASESSRLAGRSGQPDSIAGRLSTQAHIATAPHSLLLCRRR